MDATTPGEAPASGRGRWSPVVVGAASAALFVAVGAARLAIDGPPLPAVSDEFAFLLAGRTFAAGRLTNPTPTPPDLFRTFQVLVEPTYMAKYPPGNGLVLALGVLLGEPAWGPILAMAAAVGLLAWAAARVRLVAGVATGLIGAATYGVWHYWTWSYWGSTGAYLGSALLLAGVLEVSRGGRLGGGVLAGSGIGILSMTRPFEGLLMALPLVVLAVVRVGRLAREGRRWAPLAPGAALLVAAIAFQGVFNDAVTGDPLAIPYRVYEDAHWQVPYFSWESPREATPLELPRLERFRRDYMAPQARNVPPWWDRLRKRALDVVVRGAGPVFVLLLPLAFLLPCGLDRRVAGAILASHALAVTVELYYFPHYQVSAAPVMLLAGGLAVGFAADRAGRRRRGAAAVPVVLAAAACLASPLAIRGGQTGKNAFFQEFAAFRHQLGERLEALPGDDLVLVRYPPDSPMHREFVANGPDPASSPVIWGNDLGDDALPALREEYPGRRFWRLDVRWDGGDLLPLDGGDPPP
jgi:hypothetical protein